MAIPEIHILLMVEDDPFDSILRESPMESCGNRYNICHIDNLAGGLDYLRNQAPDALILDPDLNGSHGGNSVRDIRLKYPELPIIIMTSGEEKDVADMMQKHGAQDYLVKSNIDASLLHRSVRYAINGKNKELSLERDRKALHAITDALDHPLMVVDCDSSHITMANAKACKLFAGVLFSEDAPCNPACPTPLPGVLADLVAQVQTRKAVVSKYVNVTLEKGRRLRVIFYGCPVEIHPEPGDRVILYCHDITWFSKLKPDWQILMRAVEQFPDAIFIMDEDRTIRYANAAFEDLFGWSNVEITGKNPNLLVPVKQLPELDTLVREAMNTGEALAETLVCRTKDLSLFEVKCRVSPVFDEAGRPINFIAVARDITGKKRLKSIAEASSLTENLGSIFSGIRHEIGNPLNSIKMALTVLNKNLSHYPEATVQEFIERSLNEVERVESLLKEFKNFSLFETPSVEQSRIDVFLDGFIERIKKKETLKGISVLSPPLPLQEEIWGYTDPLAMEQVLSTLTDNAVDALESTQQPEIRFRLTRGDGLVHLDISDNGCGMTEAQQKALFTPFNTSKMNGTGLGLVMVKKMLARMDTTIRIKSSPDTGTCVTLSIPTEQMNHG